MRVIRVPTGSDIPWLVLDSWPILEWFYQRPPAQQAFEALLGSAARGQVRLCMSRMNQGEVYYSAAKEVSESAGQVLMRQLQALPIEIVSVTDNHVDAAARLKAVHKISYADGFAAALGIERNAAVVTGDPAFRRLAAANILSIEWLGR
jgi:predicted nucleic acid-binding protein